MPARVNTPSIDPRRRAQPGTQRRSFRSDPDGRLAIISIPCTKSSLVPNAPEGTIVIVRVIVLAGRPHVARFAAPSDDATRAAVARPRRAHCVLAVIAARANGQVPLEIAESLAV